MLLRKLSPLGYFMMNEDKYVHQELSIIKENPKILAILEACFEHDGKKRKTAAEIYRMYQELYNKEEIAEVVPAQANDLPVHL